MILAASPYSPVVKETDLKMRLSTVSEDWPASINGALKVPKNKNSWVSILKLEGIIEIRMGGEERWKLRTGNSYWRAGYRFGVNYKNCTNKSKQRDTKSVPVMFKEFKTKSKFGKKKKKKRG